MKSYNKKILESIKLDVFEIISNEADKLKLETYVVGGYVRDLILNKKLKKDIDIMCVGSGIDLAIQVQKRINPNMKVNIFKRYGTAMINYENYQIEFVGSRRESYSKDSRNPNVEYGSFIDDMLRRDFTINTRAVSLNKENYGELVDTINVIHYID